MSATPAVTRTQGCSRKPRPAARQRVDAVDAPHPPRLALRLRRAPLAPAPVGDDDEHHADGQLHRQRARRRIAVGDERLAPGDEHDEGDDGHEGEHPAEHVAQALHEAALGRQQQDHRGERDGLQGDHESDQEQVQQHCAPPIGQVEPNLHGATGRGRDSPTRRGGGSRVVALPRATTRAASPPALPPWLRMQKVDEGPPGARDPVPSMKRPFPVRDRAGSVEGELQRRRPSSMAWILARNGGRPLGPMVP